MSWRRRRPRPTERSPGGASTTDGSSWAVTKAAVQALSASEAIEESLVSEHRVSPRWDSFAVSPQELRLLPLSSRALTLHGAERPLASAVVGSRRAVTALRNSGRKSRGATVALRDFRSGSRGATTALRDPGKKS